MKQINFEQFVNSYLATASWVTCESDENTNFTKEAIKQAENDCQLFIDTVKKEMGEDKAMQLMTTPGNDLTYLAPHDFFLTRNHHGAGFWDRGNIYGEAEAKRLTEISHKLGEVNCYHKNGSKRNRLIFD